MKIPGTTLTPTADVSRTYRRDLRFWQRNLSSY